MKGLWRLNLIRARLRAMRRLRNAERAVARFPRVLPQRQHGLPFPLTLSLTSYPPRYPTLARTLKSLLDQRVRPDRTVLWLGHRDVSALPADVKALESHGLEIRRCDDLRSYKKLIPALEAFPEDAIVTADDDVYYPPYWLEELVGTVNPDRPAIICTRAHLAMIDKRGFFAPYGEWQWETHERADVDPHQRLFPTGVGGILYPPRSLDMAVTDASRFTAICPTTDDVWFFWMGETAGTPHRRIGREIPVITWKNSQEVGLVHANVFANSNDEQLARLAEFYGRPVDVPAAP